MGQYQEVVQQQPIKHIKPIQTIPPFLKNKFRGENLSNNKRDKKNKDLNKFQAYHKKCHLQF
jgi:hypothetical protein